MSRLWWVMLIFAILQLKSKSMTFTPSPRHIDDCFYQKRTDTSLHGYNDIHNHWISERDCLHRCLGLDDDQSCRSFEHWRSNPHPNQGGMCVRANISLSDEPTLQGSNAYVDYYEIDCRRDTKAVRPQTIHCPGDQLHLTITLNGIDPNYVLLGDSGCKPTWSNKTHAQFDSHVDNCSLTLSNESIVGKLRWEGVYKDTIIARRYERFFVCPSDIQQIRLAFSTLTTPLLTTTSLAVLSTRHRSTASTYVNNDSPFTASYRISLEWILNNRSYMCTDDSCQMSLYALVNVSLDDLTLLSSSRYSIESCDLNALFPYTKYLRPRRLIYRGCSIDPTVIHVSSKSRSSTPFFFSFYLFNVLKEPIPFEIQCLVLDDEQQKHISPNRNIECSSLIIDNYDRFITDKRDDSYALLRSPNVHVTRETFSTELETKTSNNQNSAVHHIECSHFAFLVLMLLSTGV